MLGFGKHIEQRKIFYRWVRKAYKLKYGHHSNVPELIPMGMSDELARKTGEVRGSVRVRKEQKQDFAASGFNARPVKLSGRYRLGTLSRHVIRSGRWKTEADAESLWKDIRKVNDLFVKRVAEDVRRIEQSRAEKKVEAVAAHGAAQTAIHSKTSPPLQVILGNAFQGSCSLGGGCFFTFPSS